MPAVLRPTHSGGPMTFLNKIALQIASSPQQRFDAAMNRYRSGSRKTKPTHSEFGIERHTASTAPIPPPAAFTPTRSEAPKQRAPAKPKPQITLKPHQAEAVDFIVRQEGKGILAHSTGSGKTITAVRAFDKLKELDKAKKAVVVVPSGLRTNFLVEGVNLASKNKGSIIGGSSERGRSGVFQIDSPDPDSDFHIVSYEIFRDNWEELLKNTGADTLIFDEFHRVKDESRGTFKAIDKARGRVKNAIGMTASIISTDPTNIIQPVRIVSGGEHGLGSKEHFEEKFLARAPAPFKKRKPVILRKPSTWANWLVPRQRKKQKTPVVGWKNTGELQDELQKHIHYVGPELVAEKMPSKHVDTVRVEMSPFQEKIYRAALKELPAPLLRKIEKGEALEGREQTDVFNRVIKARQAANSVHTLSGLTAAEAAPSTPKLQKMLDDIEDHLGQTDDGGAIIYTNLVAGGIDVIKAGLEARGLDYGLFVGKGNEGKKPGEKVTEESRQADVKAFKDGKLKVMVISGAGAEGVSLPNATFHASYDGHWNPERILQAEARGWRLGGQAHRDKEDRKVHVRRYMTVWPESRSLLGRTQAYFKNQQASDAVDEWIYSMADKRHKMNQGLKDLLRGREPQQHSLFGQDYQKPEAVIRPVEAPKLKDEEPSERDRWWGRWKLSSIERVFDEEYMLEKEAAGLPDLIGLEGFEPHTSPEFDDPEAAFPQEKKEEPKGILSTPARIMTPPDSLTDGHTRKVNTSLPWLNKEPGLKAASLFWAQAQEKEAQSAKGVLSVVVNCPYEELAGEEIRALKKKLQDRFPDLEASETQPHVTLLYARDVEDPEDPALLAEVCDALRGRNMTVKIDRVGTFRDSHKGGGVIYLKVSSDTLEPINADLQEIAQRHGGLIKHPVFKAHLTLFYHPRNFTEAEEREIAELPISSIRLERSREHVDVTVKEGDAWKKLAAADLEVGSWMSEAARHSIKEAGRTYEIPPPEPTPEVGHLHVVIPHTSFAAAGKMAIDLETHLRSLPEVVAVSTKMGADAGLVVEAELRDQYLKPEIEKLAQEHLNAKLGSANPGVRCDEDEAPQAKRWVEPKYRRPACQMSNRLELNNRTHVEYWEPEGQGIPHAPGRSSP